MPLQLQELFAILCSGYILENNVLSYKRAILVCIHMHRLKVF